MRKLMNTLWHAVQKSTELEGTFSPPSRAENSGGFIVHITFGNAEDRSIVTTGVDSDYTAAVNNAYTAYQRMNQTQKPVSLKLDVVSRVQQNKKTVSFTKEDQPISYRPGRDGFMLYQDPAYTFLPEEVQAYNLIKQGRLQQKNLLLAIQKRPQLQEDERSFSAPADVQVVRTISYYIDASGYYSLANGRRKFRTMPIETLQESLQLAKDNYFKQAVDENGRITYAYYPQTDEEAEGYNILRHAGTTYAMLELYEHSRDQEILNAATRALEYLTAFIKPHEINGKKVDIVVEEDTIKLGGNGLAIVAFAKYTQVTGDNQYLSLMQSLASWMEELQQNAPRCRIHKQYYSTGEIWDFESKYYPGEAILALVRLYEVDGDSRWLDYAEKESRYLIEVRDRDADKTSIPHDHWLLYGLYGLYRHRPLPLYRGHAFFIADTIVDAQMLDPQSTNTEMIGSYKITASIPKSTPAACRSEGLGAAARLAELVKDRTRAQRYRRSIHQAIKFQLQMQVYPESVMYFPNKLLPLGAFRVSLRGWELRNDYTQHNISSILSYLQLTEEMKGYEKVSLGLVPEKKGSSKYPVRLRTSNKKVFDECVKLGAKWRLLEGGQFKLFRGKQSYLIKEGKVLDGLNSPLALRCVKRKEVTSALLRSRELPAPENALFHTEDMNRAWEWAKPILPVVVKPGGGSKGRSVNVDISTYQAFQEAFETVSKTDQDILVEKYIRGEVYRFTYIDGEVAAVDKRRPFQVTGDAASSIEELVTHKNEERRKRAVPGHKEIEINREVKRTLRSSGWKPEDVPAAGEVVYLKKTSNVATGAEAIDATNEVSTAVKRLVAESVLSIPDLNMCGLDVIIDQDNQPHILEINNDPNITTHMEPWEGRPVNTARLIAEAMFPPLK